MKLYVEMSCPCGAQIEDEFDIDPTNFTNENAFNHYGALYCEGCTKDFNLLFKQSRGSREVFVEGASDFIYHIEDNSVLETNWVVDTPISDHLQIFSANMQEVQSLLKNQTNDAESGLLHKMLYTQTVTVMETYLSSIITHTLLNDPTLLRKFVETDRAISQRKISFGDIFEEHDNIQSTVAAELQKRVFHNLGAVEALLRDCLNLDIQIGASLHKAVNIRHHFTHRNGYDFNGNPIAVSKDDVISLIKHMATLVADLDTQVTELNN